MASPVSCVDYHIRMAVFMCVYHSITVPKCFHHDDGSSKHNFCLPFVISVKACTPPRSCLYILFKVIGRYKSSSHIIRHQCDHQHTTSGIYQTLYITLTDQVRTSPDMPFWVNVIFWTHTHILSTICNENIWNKTNVCYVIRHQSTTWILPYSCDG